jgi:hypothetical protein
MDLRIYDNSKVKWRYQDVYTGNPIGNKTNLGCELCARIG